MKVRDLLPIASFGTIATVKDEFSLRKLSFFLSHNYYFISSFKNIVVAINYMEDTNPKIIEAYKNTWTDNFSNVQLICMEKNRGHMFGTIDLEEEILKYVKNNLPEVQYLFKSMDDVLTTESVLDIEVTPSDFYYVPGFSYETILKLGSKQKLYNIYETFESGFWTPQTTFFIIRINDVHLLYGDDIERKYDIYQEQKKITPNIKPWEIPYDIKFDCETHLGRTVKNMSKFCLIGDKFKDLLDLVESVPIWDPSHKNVYFKDMGICHYHYYDQSVYEI